jgi:hypothetical protein
MKLNKPPRIQDVMTTEDRLNVSYEDGRVVSLPLKWYPRLKHATPAQRRNWELIGQGYGVHWPEVDEDLSAEGLLKGLPAREYVRSLERTSGKGRQRSVAAV